MSNEKIKVSKTSSCPSLSGRSTITYEIGNKGDSQWIRISANSAGGIFSKDWVSIDEIKSLLEGSVRITSKTLQPLYAGKSSNSPGFLLSCIINEGLAEINNPPANPVPEPSKPAKAKKQKKVDKS